jgi:hypothetical protein
VHVQVAAIVRVEDHVGGRSGEQVAAADLGESVAVLEPNLHVNADCVGDLQHVGRARNVSMVARVTSSSASAAVTNRWRCALASLRTTSSA